MQKKIFIRFLLLSFLFISPFIASGQGFIQLDQTPTTYNPSFAGQNGKTRLGITSNYCTQWDERNSNKLPSFAQSNKVSFDYSERKLKSGLGFAISNQTGKRDKLIHYNEVNKKTTSFNQFTFAFCIAPKIDWKKEDGSVRGVFSPSIGISYSFSDVNNEAQIIQMDRFDALMHNHRKQYGNTAYELGYTLPIHNKTLEAIVGVLYTTNKSKWTFGATINKRFVADNLTKRYYYLDKSDSTLVSSGNTTKPEYMYNEKDSLGTTEKRKGQYLYYSFWIEKTFKRKPTSNFSVTSYLQFSLASPSLFGNIACSLYGQYKSILLGYTISTYSKLGNGFQIGISRPKYKLCFVGSSWHDNSTAEISLNIYLNNKQ
jgi:hypothetical protein